MLSSACKEAIATCAGSSDMFINDVGQNIWEEIDRGQKGADYDRWIAGMRRFRRTLG